MTRQIKAKGIPVIVYELMLEDGRPLTDGSHVLHVNGAYCGVEIGTEKGIEIGAECSAVEGLRSLKAKLGVSAQEALQQRPDMQFDYRRRLHGPTHRIT